MIMGKVGRTVVRSTLLLMAETWAAEKEHEKNLDVVEIRTLRRMSRVTKFDNGLYLNSVARLCNITNNYNKLAYLL